MCDYSQEIFTTPFGLQLRIFRLESEWFKNKAHSFGKCTTGLYSDRNGEVFFKKRPDNFIASDFFKQKLVI
jgi:hypothetical protein